MFSSRYPICPTLSPLPSAQCVAARSKMPLHVQLPEHVAQKAGTGLRTQWETSHQIEDSRETANERDTLTTG